jgi:anti-sigma factor RsiW
MDFASIHSSVESLDNCAEEYIFDRLSPADRSAYEAHLLVCEHCRQAVERSEAFIKLFREASEEGPIQ